VPRSAGPKKQEKSTTKESEFVVPSVNECGTRLVGYLDSHIPIVVDDHIFHQMLQPIILFTKRKLVPDHNYGELSY
jgi:hypothetical protein